MSELGDNIASTFLKLLQDTSKQVNGLTKSVGRLHSKVGINFIKLESIEKYNKDCDDRLGEIEDWKSGHIGYKKGVEGKQGKSIARVTFVTVLIVTVLAGAGFLWSLKPQPINQEALKKIITEVVKESFLK